MKGFSGFKDKSPLKLNEKSKIGVKKKMTKAQEKFKLSKQTNKQTGKTSYFKISGGVSNDMGKTYTPTVKTKISKAEYDSMMGLREAKNMQKTVNKK